MLVYKKKYEISPFRFATVEMTYKANSFVSELDVKSKQTSNFKRNIKKNIKGIKKIIENFI